MTSPGRQPGEFFYASEAASHLLFSFLFSDFVRPFCPLMFAS
jgi:hypothetical protein